MNFKFLQEMLSLTEATRAERKKNKTKMGAIPIKSRAPRDPVCEQVEDLMRTMNNKEPYEYFSDEEMENGFGSGSDRAILSNLLKLRVKGISQVKTTAVNGDDGNRGVHFTFTVGGKNYSGDCFLSSGSYWCHEEK